VLFFYSDYIYQDEDDDCKEAIKGKLRVEWILILQL
jgi:hypothetical protein